MRTTRQNFFLILTLGILNALTPFTIDLYLPAFPQIAEELEVPVARMSLTISVYFIGFALGQLFYGPLLDRFGRKVPLYAGLGIYLLSSLGCYSAQSFEALLAFRFLSALGGCAASVAAMTMVRDYFPAKDSGKIYSLLMLVLSASPLLAPSLGGLMLTAWSWRALFLALSILAAIDMVLVALVLPKGCGPDRSVNLSWKPLYLTFRKILRQPQFRTYTIAGSLSFAGLFVFVAGSPALFMQGFGVTAKEFGFIFATLAGGMVGGGQLNHLLLKVADGKRIFRTALVLQVGVSALFLLGIITSDLGLRTTVSFLFLALTCAGVAYPHAAATALEPFTKNIGSASALLGFLQLGLGSVAAALVGILGGEGAFPAAAVMCGCSAVGWILLARSNDRMISADASGPVDQVG